MSPQSRPWIGPITCGILLSAAVSCSERPTAPHSAMIPAGPSLMIGDGGHTPGTGHFFFLLPTVVPQTFAGLFFSGTFDGTVNASARVCAGTAPCSSAAAIASFTSAGGTGGTAFAKVRVSPLLQSYSAVWDTRLCATGPCALEAGLTYRLHIYATNAASAEVELGFADLDVVSTAGQLLSLDTRAYSPLVKGLPYTIAFRIERGVVGSVSVTPLTGALFIGASQLFTATVADLHGAPLASTATWASSDATVASVTPLGVVTGVARGTATITATSDGKRGVASIVACAAATQLVVTVFPGEIDQNGVEHLTPGRPLGAVLEVRDASGNLVSCATNVVTLGYNFANEYRLIGNHSVQAIGGVATFDLLLPPQWPAYFGVHYSSPGLTPTFVYGGEWDVYPAPTLTSVAATAITSTGFTANALVNPNGNEMVWFEYSTSSSLLAPTRTSLQSLTGDGPVAANASITGLVPNTSYYFRVGGGSRDFTYNYYGAVLTVTTAP